MGKIGDFNDTFALDISKNKEKQEEVNEWFDLLKPTIYVLLVSGIVTFVLNLLSLIALGLDKNVGCHNKFVFLRYLCFAYCLFGIGLMVISSEKLQYFSISCNAITNGCFWENFLFEVSLFQIIDGNLCAALDRCFAIFAPAYYCQKYKRFVKFGILTLAILHSILVEIQIYYNMQNSRSWRCCMVAFSSLYDSWSIKAQLILPIMITILLYIVLIVFIKFKINKIKGEDNSAHLHYQLKEKLLITLILCVLSYILTIVLSMIVISIAYSYYNFTDAVQISQYALFGYFSGIVHFALLFYRTEEFRIAILNIITNWKILQMRKINASSILPENRSCTIKKSRATTSVIS
ncbi:hypothetical protein T11_2926 [Trichinella zimbabwensis]|uniref:G-protein coupled receptors family 1 profile domain-containing protein n=1 Tax=Trichinella zimbabwensis TaxID=268475 RepID=A0A0V1I2J9_9BILA|nr:hypothetical protein T11_2926 [Trichinella zimbabwensis]